MIMKMQIYRRGEHCFRLKQSKKNFFKVLLSQTLSHSHSITLTLLLHTCYDANLSYFLKFAKKYMIILKKSYSRIILCKNLSLIMTHQNITCETFLHVVGKMWHTAAVIIRTTNLLMQYHIT